MTADAPNARAIRILPSLTAEELDAFENGGYNQIFQTASDVNLPVFVYIAGHVELMPRYLKAFPDVSFIVDHCGMPMEVGISFLDEKTPEEASGEGDHAGPNIEYFDEVLKLASYANVSLKWSHAQGMFGILDTPPTILCQSYAEPLMPFALNASCGQATWAAIKPERAGLSCCSTCVIVLNSRKTKKPG